jgi:hypothetical protein
MPAMCLMPRLKAANAALPYLHQAFRQGKAIVEPLVVGSCECGSRIHSVGGWRRGQSPRIRAPIVMYMSRGRVLNFRETRGRCIARRAAARDRRLAAQGLRREGTVSAAAGCRRPRAWRWHLLTWSSLLRTWALRSFEENLLLGSVQREITRLARKIEASVVEEHGAREHDVANSTISATYS